MADAKQIKIARTPAGIARFPYLNEPDAGQPEWANYVPHYKVDLVFDEAPADLVKLVDETIQAAREEAQSKAKSAKGRKSTPSQAADPYFPETDQEGEETGRVCFRFSAKSEFTDKNGKVKPIHIGLYDAKKRPTTDEIGMGSTLKVAFKPIPWVNPKLEYGCTLRLMAVQIIDLVAPGGAGVDSSVFDEEDGFEAEEKPEDQFEEEEGNTNPEPDPGEDDDAGGDF